MTARRTIAYLSDSQVPSRLANAVHVMRMSRAFAATGAAVTLYALRGDGDRAADPFTVYGVDRAFELKYVPRLPVPWQAMWTALYSVRDARRAGAGLAYTRSIYSAYLAAHAGVPVVAELHAKLSPYENAKASILRRAIAVGTTRGLVVISEPLQHYYAQRLGVSRDAILVAPDGADPISTDVVPAPIRVGDRLVVGYLGQLFHGRGIELIADLARRCPWADFHVVGGFDSDAASWRQRCASVPNIVFHGFVPPRDTTAYLSAFDVALAPYQQQVTILNQGDSSTWMSPMKIFEYMAAGTAVVCSDLPVLRPVLRDGENALLCPADAAAAWERALIRLRDEPSLRDRLASAARTELEARYTWSRRAATILDWIDGRAARVAPAAA
jgi:glycosyltransferase involved in cell wall biosynthesis